MSIHYLEDMNNSYHASLHTSSNSNHHEYEYWVTEHVGVPSILNEDITSSYRYVYDNMAITMANNFAGLAKASYSVLL